MHLYSHDTQASKHISERHADILDRVLKVSIVVAHNMNLVNEKRREDGVSFYAAQFLQ